jgi:hypothetical protein
MFPKKRHLVLWNYSIVAFERHQQAMQRRAVYGTPVVGSSVAYLEVDARADFAEVWLLWMRVGDRIATVVLGVS